MAAPDPQLYVVEVQLAKSELRRRLNGQNGLALDLIQLHLNDALTYDAGSNFGGANGSILGDKELKHACNLHLMEAAQFISQIQKDLNLQIITTSDLVHLAGEVAIESLGGLSYGFKPGRKVSKVSPPEGKIYQTKDLQKFLSNGKRASLEPSQRAVVLILLWGLMTKREDEATGVVWDIRDMHECASRLLTQCSSQGVAIPEDVSPHLQAIAKDFNKFIQTVKSAQYSLSTLGTKLKEPVQQDRTLGQYITVEATGTLITGFAIGVVAVLAMQRFRRQPRFS